MRYYSIPFFLFFLALTACDKEEASEYQRTTANFKDSLGGDVSAMQWWQTAVKLRITVTTDEPVKLMLLSAKSGSAVLYDYKEVAKSGIVYMTAPQGQGNTLYLNCLYKGKTFTQSITLTGKPEENISLNTTIMGTRRARVEQHAASLSGASINGDAKYYSFNDAQLKDYFHMLDICEEKADAKNTLRLNCNYELESNGPFYITWVMGNGAEQRSHILGYYYHSPYTYDDIKYVDLSETHKWDYIDGLAKVQYQINREDEVDGHHFYPNTWYDANFDMSDVYGATWCYNMDRVGDDAYNTRTVYLKYGEEVSALRGISFKIDVPEDTRIGFYLRADEEPYPDQWTQLRAIGIKPYVANKADFMGTCFSAEFMNVVGNGKGQHRSFIKAYDEVYWMGMEDLIEGGDHDCNDVLFGVESELKIWMPEIVEPGVIDKPVDPVDPVNPDDPDDPDTPVTDTTPYPWTIAYEDVHRDADFDFNDAVIKVVPDYDSELCCVTVMAAGSTSRMYLHYDGPDGDVNMGEIHDLMGKKNDLTYINTQEALAGTPFSLIDCVPWPKGYTMGNDAKRFYIEIQRGTCDDCTDVITLANEPGQMPEALLVAGEWQWPMEGVHIFNAYGDFPQWSKDVTRTRFWEWYKAPQYDSYVSY